MVRLYKRRMSGGSLDKYYVKCKDPSDASFWLQQPHALDVNNERAIVRAMIDDAIVRKNQQVVLKIGPSGSLQKEYDYARALKHVPGFARFICAMQCLDALGRYKRDPHAKVCSGDPNDEDMNVLVMPFFSMGSVRKYVWANNPQKLRSCLKQIVLSLYVAFVDHGFIHSDIHLDNVLLSATQKATIAYTLPGNKTIHVPTSRLRIQIMDLERAFMPVDVRQTRHLFRDLDRVVKDLKYAARVTFAQLPELSMFTERRTSVDAPATLQSDVLAMLAIIDRIDRVDDEPAPTLVYDPRELARPRKRAWLQSALANVQPQAQLAE
jgi:serine/threonine protein kinase